jgi:hypothetical protein
MGNITWTKKGLRLDGEILDSKSVEKWIQEKGQDIVEEKLKTLPAKWLAGRTRARRRIRTELLKDVSRSKNLQNAIQESLSRLPDVIFDVTQQIEFRKISNLLRIGADFTITACPRGVIVRSYLSKIFEDLSEFDELERYESFFDFFLGGLAVKSENNFFKFKRKMLSNGGRSAVVDINRDYNWNIDGYNGHYYVCFFRWKIDVPTEKKARKMLENYSRDKIGDIEINLGSLSKTEFKELSDKLARFL